MSTNLSEKRRNKMLETLANLRTTLQDNPETCNMLMEIENELNKKKYGLIWEEHEEFVDEELKTKIPVFVEDKSLEIKCNEKDSYNFLIEGDNLHSLYLLEKTHKNKIDVIYIDPPYNTGHKDFIYDDLLVDKNDGYSHSKWLSFMEKRLKIARRLLTEYGVIFISIDDNEGYQLKLLCDSIFGENNFISNIVWNSRKSVSNDAIVSLNHNYTLVYTKNFDSFNKRKKDFKLQTTPKGFSNPDNDSRGLWKADPFDSPGIRPNLTYEILNPNTGKKYLPPQGRCWRTGEKEYREYLADNRIIFGKNGTSKPQLKRFLYEAEEKGTTPKSIWDDCGTATDGTKEIIDIFGEKVFSTPKPTSFIRKILELSSYKESIILDFFAGSGTTGQAVVDLNADDGGNRKFILCTNNEENICSNITYKRLKTIFTGVRDDKSQYSQGKSENLKYYKTEYINRFNKEDENYYIVNELSSYIKELVQLEQGIDITNPKVHIIFDEETADKILFNEELIKKCEIIYIDRNVMLTNEQQDIIFENKISICEIPEYYFENEIMEVEGW